MQHVERKERKKICEREGVQSRKNEKRMGILASYCLCNKERKGYRHETGMDDEKKKRMAYAIVRL